MRVVVLFSLSLAACRCPAPAQLAHYESAGAMRHALYAGDLGTVADAASRLDGGPRATVAGPMGGEEAELALHAAAGFLMAGADEIEAAEGVAAVARACGACHRAAGVVLPVASVSLEVGPGGLLAEHPRVADALWWSLVAADTGAAQAGLAGLEAEPIMPPGSTGGAPAGELWRQVREAQGEPLDRAELAYARLSAGCASCHAAARRE